MEEALSPLDFIWGEVGLCIICITKKIKNERRGQVEEVKKGGLYHCRGGRGDPVYYTEDSSEFIVEETSQTEKPRASLGGSVTLNCSVNDSARWRYYWFRRTSESSAAQRITNGTSSHTFSVAEGGIYYCRGGRGDPVFFTEDSVSVTIETNGFRCESHSFLVPFIIGLVFGSLLTVPVLLCCICCHTRIRDRCRNSLQTSINPLLHPKLLTKVTLRFTPLFSTVIFLSMNRSETLESLEVTFIRVTHILPISTSLTPQSELHPSLSLHLHHHQSLDSRGNSPKSYHCLDSVLP
ncbi:uncharacterized protein LOC143416664 [Maylandia zebra]|uniref:uncharacterized protein LOC143416664 n=1 Tax=Maylandia zebra TaxID=106582 RepID=UPI00403D3615